MNKLNLLLVAVILVGCASKQSDRTARFEPSTKGKKLVSYGQDWPNTAYVKNHISEMEKHPFDGVVIGVTEATEEQLNGGTLGTKAWGKTQYKQADYEHAIAELRATKFRKFTDNWIQVEVMPGDVDFFDPQWSAVVENFRILARVARQGGCVGLEFDPEEYGAEHVWTYKAWSEARQKTHTEDEYVTKSRQRGEELMRAVNQEFPGIKILCLFGPTMTAHGLQSGSHRYRLLAPFIEGMCRAADDKSQIIDGYEFSYGYRTLLAFEEGRKAILDARSTFEDPNLYDRKVRVGFGLWTDNNSGKLGWHPDEPRRNHFSPASYQTAVFSALSFTDRYVWVWREKIHEWKNEQVSAAYEQAMIDGRSRPGSGDISQLNDEEVKGKQIARAAQVDEDKGHTFDDLMRTQNLLVDLPNDGWLFKLDPQNVGITQKWFATDLPSSGWNKIEVGKFWEEQGWDYDGVAWYRRTFKVSRVPTKRTMIVFGAVDESATLWINGELVGSHDIGEGGWKERFGFDITNLLQKGDNEIAVRVIDRTGPGGIWKPVKIFIAK